MVCIKLATTRRTLMSSRQQDTTRLHSPNHNKIPGPFGGLAQNCVSKMDSFHKGPVSQSEPYYKPVLRPYTGTGTGTCVHRILYLNLNLKGTGTGTGTGTATGTGGVRNDISGKPTRHGSSIRSVVRAHRYYVNPMVILCMALLSMMLTVAHLSQGQNSLYKPYNPYIIPL